jgi:hypothetical protein
MILDTLLQFATKLALSTAGTGRALVGDVVDLGTPNGPTAITTSTVFRDIGGADPLFLIILITTAVTSAGAATVSFELSSDATAAISVDGVTEAIHFATVAFPKATLIANFVAAAVQVPRDGGAPYKRFLGIVQNVGTAALTAGAFSAFLTSTPALWKAYTDGV